MLSLRVLLTSAPVVALAAAMAPAPADACQPDPCLESNRWTQFEVVSEVVAPDGVLRIQAARNPGTRSLADSLFFAELQVRDADANLIDGSFEYIDELRALVWRPASPLDPSATYSANLRVDNDALAESLDEGWVVEESWCGENIETALSFQTSEDALGPLVIPNHDVSTEHRVEDVRELDTLVCCDGAYPYRELWDCFEGEEILWDGGHCASTVGRGFVRATLTLPEEELAPEVRNNLALRVVDAGGQVRGANPLSLSVSYEDDQPFCAQLEVYDLAYGDSWVSPMHCVGDDLADQLGEHAISPADGLAACQDEPYTCEFEEERWDQAACEPWIDPDPSGDDDDDDDDDDDIDVDPIDLPGDPLDDPGLDQDDDITDRGCACRAQSDRSSPFALWLLLAGLAWRGAARRRRSA